jgi:hypothetical protein
MVMMEGKTIRHRLEGARFKVDQLLELASGPAVTAGDPHIEYAIA